MFVMFTFFKTKMRVGDIVQRKWLKIFLENNSLNGDDKSEPKLKHSNEGKEVTVEKCFTSLF